MNTCNRCGGLYEKRIAPRTVRFDSRRSALVDAEFYQCSQCGDSYFTLEQADAARRLASEAIRRQEGLLLAGEITALRKGLGMSQDAFQHLLGKGKKTVVRWEAGAVFQSKTADRLMRLIRDVEGAAEYLADLSGIDLPNSGTVSVRTIVYPANLTIQNVTHVFLSPGAATATATAVTGGGGGGAIAQMINPLAWRPMGSVPA